MDPILALEVADGLVGLIEKLAPDIEQAVQKGLIPAEMQQKLFDRVKVLRPGGTAFTGPEWNKSTDPQPVDTHPTGPGTQPPG
jgi:hypothetical protein